MTTSEKIVIAGLIIVALTLFWTLGQAIIKLWEIIV